MRTWAVEMRNKIKPGRKLTEDYSCPEEKVHMARAVLAEVCGWRELPEKSLYRKSWRRMRRILTTEPLSDLTLSIQKMERRQHTQSQISQLWRCLSASRRQLPVFSSAGGRSSALPVIPEAFQVSQRAPEVLEQPVWGEPCPASEDSTSTEPAKQPGKGARSPAVVANDCASSGSIRPDRCDRVVARGKCPRPPSS
ncbi:uncharacterized protein ACIQIH_007174 isoform 2-T6 [Cyanocitta cristata]